MLSRADTAAAWPDRRAVPAGAHRPALAIACEPGVLADVQLRPITQADLPFLCRVYASAREDELAALAWSSVEKSAFLSQQFACQHQYYQEHYADAQFMVIMRGTHAIGRLYWLDRAGHAVLIDFSLLPQWRGTGIGTALLRQLLQRADVARQSTTLHVEPTNRAQHLYRRHGFTVLADNGVYLRMHRAPREGVR